MTIDEYEALIAQGMDPQDINRPGGVHLGGMPNVGNGPPGLRNQMQRQAVENLQRRQDAPQATQQAIRRPFNMEAYSDASSPQQDFLDAMGPSAQAQHLKGMIADVQNAWQDENDSRVAQNREQRRMEHETQLAAMDNDTLLRRLEMEQQEREKDRLLQKQLMSGTVTRQFIDGEWREV